MTSRNRRRGSALQFESLEGRVVLSHAGLAPHTLGATALVDAKVIHHHKPPVHHHKPPVHHHKPPVHHPGPAAIDHAQDMKSPGADASMDMKPDGKK